MLLNFSSRHTSLSPPKFHKDVPPSSSYCEFGNCPPRAFPQWGDRKSRGLPTSVKQVTPSPAANPKPSPLEGQRWRPRSSTPRLSIPCLGRRNNSSVTPLTASWLQIIQIKPRVPGIINYFHSIARSSHTWQRACSLDRALPLTEKLFLGELRKLGRCSGMLDLDVFYSS